MTKDPYGVESRDSWDLELKHFFEKVISPSLTKDQLEVLAESPDYLRNMIATIDGEVRMRADDITESLSFDIDMNPVEFEKWCATKIYEAGWNTETTSLSGDQGADIVATKKIGTKSVRMVAQCKLHTRPIGNKAVQEAHAAKSHYFADIAVVISNTSYTPSAKRLAATTGVELWQVSDLERVKDLLEASHS